MTIVDKGELIFIPILGIIFWMIAPTLPNNIELGRLLLFISALLLLQSLIRDLWLLNKTRVQNEQQPDSPKSMSCMCLESTIGITGIVVGSIFLISGIANYSIFMQNWAWSVLAMVIMVVGFLIKDYILQWNPWRIRRDKNHQNIIFIWKNK